MNPDTFNQVKEALELGGKAITTVAGLWLAFRALRIKDRSVTLAEKREERKARREEKENG
ncbi:hypothetical protein C1Y63_04820 [Corynebacterium sp. 13CS0277]|uniref:hypothetical protein n=1 Tax=Corynebacterium sp. 13CS0277 TaxID=2071994 RepID=UPI000D0406D0|nr:hypothetical protein [Corynebacterium sp. 13CS0277]PRQ11734.1 hypothetical protein C1Y63_04820 [Corynebacterium sp. 13CS0277]